MKRWNPYPCGVLDCPDPATVIACHATARERVAVLGTTTQGARLGLCDAHLKQMRDGGCPECQEAGGTHADGCRVGLEEANVAPEAGREAPGAGGSRGDREAPGRRLALPAPDAPRHQEKKPAGKRKRNA